MARLRNKQVEKVKLAAIAKNEAAYLCEWIFHHLYFGFDRIEIHYNGCTDNTQELAPLMREYPVSFVCADSIFGQSSGSPQIAVYQKVLRKSRQEGYDAVLFLDIDEFWTPVDLTSSIKEIIDGISFFDTLSFQWKNKQEQQEMFAPAMQQQISVQHAPQIKTLYKTYLKPKEMNAHCMLDNGLVHRFENGQVTQFINEQKSRVSISHYPSNAFILHRKERSEREYIASLIRGRPIKTNNENVILKDNRRGFPSDIKASTYCFPSPSFKNYREFLLSKQSIEMDAFQKLAQDNVSKAYQSVFKLIEIPTLEQKRLFKKLLHGVNDENVRGIMANW